MTPYVQTKDMIRGFPSGLYQVVLTNTGTKAISAQKPLQEAVRVDMGWLNFQQTMCPPEDQNIGPII